MIEPKFRLSPAELDELIERCVGRFYRGLRRNCPAMLDHVLREDLVGQAYLIVCESTPKRKREVPLNYFLVASIANGLQQYMYWEVKDKRGLTDRDFDIVLRNKAVEEDKDLRDMRLDLDLSVLTEKQQTLLVALYEGYTFREIGETLGISTSRVGQLKDEIINTLRK